MTYEVLPYPHTKLCLEEWGDSELAECSEHGSFPPPARHLQSTEAVLVGPVEEEQARVQCRSRDIPYMGDELKRSAQAWSEWRPAPSVPHAVASDLERRKALVTVPGVITTIQYRRGPAWSPRSES